MPLCTQDDVEKLLQIDFGADPDASVAQYIAQADAIVVSYCGQELEAGASLTATLEADPGQTWLFLPRFPVTAINSVTENATVLTVTDEYRWYQDGRLRRMAGDFDSWWWTGPDGVVVDYDAGYSTIPADVTLAAATLAADLFRQGAAFAAHGVNPVKSVALDGSDTITYDTLTATGEFSLGRAVAVLLAPYRRRTL